MTVRRYTFSLSLSPIQLQQYYRGELTTLLVVSEQGLRIQLPLSALRPYFSHTGVKGRFLLEVSSQGKLRRLKQLS